MSYITYTDDEINIVEKGIEEVRKVLMGEDRGKKRSLLFFKIDIGHLYK